MLFSLDAGPVTLDVTLRGPVRAEHEALVRDRLSAFVVPPSTPSGASAFPGPPRPARRITCDWTLTDGAWVDYAADGGGEQPMATALSPTAWWAEWCYYRASFTDTRSDGLVSGRHPGLEHALRAAAVFGTMPRDALFFHAATLVIDGRAWMFAGLPNAGKSTLAAEAESERVISNEISVCALRDGVWTALPSPFWGTGDVAERAAPAPLAGAVVLTQATERNVWARLTGGSAIAALMPHVGCQAAAQLADPRLLGQLSALAGAIPVGSLAWYRQAQPLEGLPWKP